MSATVGVNGLAVIHEASEGTSVAFPDTCLAPAAPVPFSNIAPSSALTGGSTDVRCEGHPVALSGARIESSSGDEAGVGGGVASLETQGSAAPVLYSFDVKIEGRNVVRAFDLFVHNNDNTGPAPLVGPFFPDDRDE
ncbi:MAG: DUF4150 domain-containing protein [Byssovorax sp.]